MANDHKGHSKITILVIMISLSNTIGNVPYSMYSLLSNFISIYPTIIDYTVFLLYLYKSSNIFLFFFFNNNYRNLFNGYIKELKRIFPVKRKSFK